MANRSSQQLINRDATPVVLNSPTLGGRGNLRGAYGQAQILTTDATSSIIRLCSIPSNAVVRSIRYFCGAGGGSAAADLGLYRTTRDGSAAVDSDYFGTAISLVSAVSAGTEIAHESGSYSIARREQPIWQALAGGLFSADPNCMFDLALTLTAVVASDISAGVEVTYMD